MVNRNLPPVSIGIPFYNAESFLMDSIKSVFAQTHQNWELILMDDGSTDRSLEIALSIDDPRVRVYSDGKNKKLAARLNEIHMLAKYDFVARMDADDMMASNRIEKQLSFLLKNPELDLVTTGICSITDDSIAYGIRIPPTDHVITPYVVLSGAHGITHAAILGKKEWFIRNPYNPLDKRAQDYKLWVRSTKKNDLAIGFLNEPLYFYREIGSATPKKMLSSKRIRREVLLKNGLAMIGRVRTSYLLGRTLLQSAAINCASYIGHTDFIVKARNPIQHKNILQTVQTEIEMIKNITIKKLRN